MTLPTDPQFNGGPGGRANHGGIYQKPQLPDTTDEVTVNPNNSQIATHGGIIHLDPAVYRSES